MPYAYIVAYYARRHRKGLGWFEFVIECYRGPTDMPMYACNESVWLVPGGEP